MSIYERFITMVKFIKKLFENDKIRYLFAGGLTTLVNLVAFYLLRWITPIDRNVCNVIAIILAMIFAYLINKLFVFQSHKENVGDLIVEAVAFFGARILSMVIEVLGFALLCDSFRFNEFISKILVQFVVIVVNYFFSKLIVFKDEEKTIKEKLEDNWSWLLSAGLALIFMLIVYAVAGVAPFGTDSVTIIDSMHQYLPFFSDYQDKLQNEGSLFYSFDIGMGVNFLSLLLYYMASPLNLILILFKRTAISSAMAIIIACKISIAAGSFGFFLSRRRGKINNNFFITAFSLAYALSDYMVGYFWNLMWLDCIMVFPLIMLGFEDLMEERDNKLYPIALFYAMFCNYYIAFIICIFLVLWFFAYNHKDAKKMLNDGLRFALYSIISAMMAAFSLLAAYLGIMTTASAGAGVPNHEWYGSVFELLKKMIILTEPITNQTFDGGVNLYCGTMAILCMFLYFYSNRVKLWDKIGRGLLIIFLVVSFNETILNYLWHGFHNQYGIPNRFSFLFIFMVLYMGYEICVKLKRLNVLCVVSALLFALSFVFICKYQNTLSDDYNDYIIVGISCGLLVLYSVFIILRIKEVMKPKITEAIISGLLVVEILVNAGFGFYQNGFANGKYYLSDVSTMKTMVEQVDEYSREQGYGFYREELADPIMLDEATLNNMASVGTFCSTVPGSMVDMMDELGFYTGANEYLYKGATPVTDAMLGVRYNYVRDDDYFAPGMNYELLYDEDVLVYENQYALPVAYAVNNNIEYWKPVKSDAAMTQNDFVTLTSGAGDVFDKVIPPLSATGKNCTAKPQESNPSIIEYFADGEEKIVITASFTVDMAGQYFVYGSANYIEKVRIYINDEEVGYGRFQTQMLNLGSLKAGDSVSIEYNFNSNFSPSGTVKTRIYRLNEENFKAFYDSVSAETLNVTDYKDGYIEGDITLSESKTLFTSIVNDKGWTAYVDGKKVDITENEYAFISLKLDAGEHHIVFKYMPQGLYLGIIISAFGWGLFIVIINKKREEIIQNEEKVD